MSVQEDESVGQPAPIVTNIVQTAELEKPKENLPEIEPVEHDFDAFN